MFFRPFRISLLGALVTKKGTRRRRLTTAIFSLPWHYLHSLNKLLVKAIRTKREWQSPILLV